MARKALSRLFPVSALPSTFKEIIKKAFGVPESAPENAPDKR
jgi:hypothetical protein